MSLPSPTTTTSGAMDPALLQAMERPLMELAQKSGGDLRKLLYAFFSFLHRRTDFYCMVDDEPTAMGFREGDAEKLLLAAFRQFPLRRISARQPASPPSLFSSQQKAKSPKSESKKHSTQSKTILPVKQSDKSIHGETKVKSTTEAKTKDRPSSQPRTIAPGIDTTTNAPRFTEEGLQIPEGNGGVTDRYRWTQTLDETTVIVAVPENTRGKDLEVSLKSTSLSVKLKANKNEPVLEGALTNTIDVDESTWSLEGGALLLILQKQKPMSWWETVLKGDDKIDTTLVDSRRHIDSYDESTQGAIRKILFDQRQERLGLPTSNEILRKEGGGAPMDVVPPLPHGVEYIDKDTLDKGKS